MNVNANEVMIWIEVGEKLIRLGVGTYASVMAALQAAGIQADQERLDEIHADYQARIARATAVANAGEASPPVNP